MVTVRIWREKWWAHQDLNLGQTDYESATLTNWVIGPLIFARSPNTSLEMILSAVMYLRAFPRKNHLLFFEFLASLKFVVASIAYSLLLDFSRSVTYSSTLPLSKRSCASITKIWLCQAATIWMLRLIIQSIYFLFQVSRIKTLKQRWGPLKMRCIIERPIRDRSSSSLVIQERSKMIWSRRMA